MNRTKRKREKITISPARVRFTQDSVGMYFQNGNDLNTTCEDIAKGELDVDEFPKIRVLLHDDEYYSVDNRRLYIFRVLHILGLLPLIVVFNVDTFDREFTTKNKGCHIRIRPKLDNNDEWERATIYQHCPCKWKIKRIPVWWDQRRRCHRSLPAPRDNEPVHIFHPPRDTNRSSRYKSNVPTGNQNTRNVPRNQNYAFEDSSDDGIDITRSHTWQATDMSQSNWQDTSKSERVNHPINVLESTPVRNLPSHWNTASIWSTWKDSGHDSGFCIEDTTHQFRRSQNTNPATDATGIGTEESLSKQPAQVDNPRISTTRLPQQLTPEIRRSPHDTYKEARVSDRQHSLPVERNVVQADVATQRESVRKHHSTDQQTDSIEIHGGRECNTEVEAEKSRKCGRLSWLLSRLCCCCVKPRRSADQEDA